MLSTGVPLFHSHETGPENSPSEKQNILNVSLNVLPGSTELLRLIPVTFISTFGGSAGYKNDYHANCKLKHCKVTYACN